MIDEKELARIVKDSVTRPEETIDEGYVAQAKVYPQVTDLLSTNSKDAHTRIYQGYVEKLSRVAAELDASDKLESNSLSSDYRKLRSDEAYLHNAVYLHELFFANCFDPHSEVYMNSLAYMRLQRDFGTFEAWQADFIAAAGACRNGWVICGYSTFLKRFVNTFVDGHSTGVMLGLIPMAVVDMHEHAFCKDYSDDKKSYLISMMREFNWDVIESRFERAEAIGEALK